MSKGLLLNVWKTKLDWFGSGCTRTYILTGRREKRESYVWMSRHKICSETEKDGELRKPR